MDENIKSRPQRSERIPRFTIVVFILTALTAILHFISSTSMAFSDFFNANISSIVRFILAKITSWLPFSLAEVLFILIPVIFLCVLRYAIKNRSSSYKAVGIYCLEILSFVCCFYILFFWAYGVGYGTTPLEKKLNLDTENITADELLSTAIWLAEEANKAAGDVRYDKSGFSVIPYGYDKMSENIIDAYNKYTESNNYLSRLDSRIKPIMLSEAMAYTHISGVYTFFTGEANVNTAFPPYTIPFTAAHEFAHQRGIAPEDEANFVSFDVLRGSEDFYLRYSAYLNMLEYVLDALYRANPQKYTLALSYVDKNVAGEMKAYNIFFKKYEGSAAGSVSEAINDTFLKLNGTEGSVSYGLVVRLAAGLHRSIKEE